MNGTANLSESKFHFI